MLIVNADLEYIQRFLGISPTVFNAKYSMKTVDEIIDAEAAEGNQKAIELAKELTTNINLVIKLFELADSNNKLAILKEMSSKQLVEFLPEMDDKDLIQGLYFFTQDKLLKMIEALPMEQVVKTAFELFSKEEIVQLMPDDQLDKFLTSTDIDKNKILKHMQSIPSEYLAQVLEQVTGESVDNLNSVELTKKIGELNPLEYKDVLTAFQPTQKQQLVLSLGKEHNEWFQLFDAHAYTKIMNREKHQPELVKGMAVIDPEHIENMIKELPNDLLSIVITQIDTEKFAYILMYKFPEMIADLMLR